MVRLITRSTKRPVEIQRNDSDGAIISGYGAVYYREGDESTEYRITDKIVERFLPGCFDFPLDDVRCMFNHDPNQMLGRTKSGTLSIEFDDIGPKYRANLDPGNPVHRTVESNLARGDVDGSSIWFYIEEDNQREENGQIIFEITSVKKCVEMGPVSIPAYDGASADLRLRHFADRISQAEGRSMINYDDIANAKMWLWQQDEREKRE